MKKILLSFLLLTTAFFVKGSELNITARVISSVFTTTLRPQGNPSPSSNGYAKYGFMRADSGFIWGLRDTFPALYPTIIWHTNLNFYKTTGNGAAWTLFIPNTPSSGTVTSVGSGWGILGGPITESGTLFADSSVVVSKSYFNNLAVKYSDTSTMLLPYARISNLADSNFWRNVSSNTITTKGSIQNISLTGSETIGSASNTSYGSLITNNTSSTPTLNVNNIGVGSLASFSANGVQKVGISGQGVITTTTGVQSGTLTVTGGAQLGTITSVGVAGYAGNIDASIPPLGFITRKYTDSTLSLKLNISDTASMLSPYARTGNIVTSPFQGTSNITSVTPGANLSMTGNILSTATVIGQTVSAVGSVLANNLSITGNALISKDWTGTTSLIISNNLTGTASSSELLISANDPVAGQFLNYLAVRVFPYSIAGDVDSVAWAGNSLINVGGGTKDLIFFNDGIGQIMFSTQKPLNSSIKYYKNDLVLGKPSYNYTAASGGIGVGTYFPSVLRQFDSSAHGITIQGPAKQFVQFVDTGAVVNNTVVGQIEAFGDKSNLYQLAGIDFINKGTLKNSGQIDLFTMANSVRGTALTADSNHNIQIPNVAIIGTASVTGTISVGNIANATGNFATYSVGGTLQQRLPSEVRGDIGAGTGNGTVTSVGTGLGLLGGTITTTGTIRADTTYLVEKANTQVITGQKYFTNGVFISGTNPQLYVGNPTIGTGSFVPTLNIYNATGNKYFQLEIDNTTGSIMFVDGASATSRLNIFPAGAITAGGSITTTGNIQGASITSTGGISGTLTTAAQPNITSVGILTVLTMNGNINFSSGNLSVGSGSITGGQIVSTLGNNSLLFNSNSATTGYQYAQISNTSGSLRMGIDNSTGGALATGSLAYSTVIGSITNTAVHFATNNIVRQTIDGSGNTTFTAPIAAGGYTVSTLPAGAIGMMTYVTDALAPGFLTIVVGGGTVKTPVFYNGTNWVAF